MGKTITKTIGQIILADVWIHNKGVSSVDVKVDVAIAKGNTIYKTGGWLQTTLPVCENRRFRGARLDTSGMSPGTYDFLVIVKDVNDKEIARKSYSSVITLQAPPSEEKNVLSYHNAYFSSSQNALVGEVRVYNKYSETKYFWIDYYFETPSKTYSSYQRVQLSPNQESPTFVFKKEDPKSVYKGTWTCTVEVWLEYPVGNRWRLEGKDTKYVTV
jgi:hypothetical protein